ncbi:Gfo/Idh/MocA family oxidoreductase [Actinocrispum sp. NPDC049592]|uniref:Gfo/Idh/MocA family protein n=1 Tax=Actinocrispum sp. NPDC049592 TaxID=3154835 RepID=UPI00343847A6
MGRYAVVGTGARAELYVRALVGGVGELVGLADVNGTRMAAHNDLIARLGGQRVAEYAAGDFLRMLDEQRVDTVIVTTVDRFHDTYIIEALDAGRDVITEKPMTVDAPSCAKILEAVHRNDGRLTVTFNYRYNPVHEKVRELLLRGEIGTIGSVHFEWLLDIRHGADYFRRWHRDKANSGGLMVHKATHHFDLLNWWIGAAPETVYAQQRLFFYGKENGVRHGYARDYERADRDPAAAADPFALHLAEDARLTKLYLEAEHEDGYHRDQNVFGDGVSIEDDMAVLIRYTNGANVTYHLTAYSPWEGYRVMFNGSKGRLELEVVENDHVSLNEDKDTEAGWATLTVHPFWQPPFAVPLQFDRSGHGGADARMLRDLFRPREDPLNRRADHRDGARSLLTGFAANQSRATGEPVHVADLLDLR